MIARAIPGSAMSAYPQPLGTEPAKSVDYGPRLDLAPTSPPPGAIAGTAISPEALPDDGPPVFPYLPAPTGEVDYNYQAILRPEAGAAIVFAEFRRFVWNVAADKKSVHLSEIEPLSIDGRPGVPTPVEVPAGIDTTRPQCWVVAKANTSDILIGAVPRRPSAPLLQVIPGKLPEAAIGDHVMALPPRVDLPEMKHILPCTLQVFPLTPSCGIAVRFRMSEQGTAIGLTPYLFRATLNGPRSWNLLSGRRLLEEDPLTGERDELVEATPQAGQLAPVVTVFAGRCLATFSWRATPDAPCFNLAGLAPEERTTDVAQEQRRSLYDL